MAVVRLWLTLHTWEGENGSPLTGVLFSELLVLSVKEFAQSPSERSALSLVFFLGRDGEGESNLPAGRVLWGTGFPWLVPTWGLHKAGAGVWYLTSSVQSSWAGYAPSRTGGLGGLTDSERSKLPTSLHTIGSCRAWHTFCSHFMVHLVITFHFYFVL